MSLSTLHGRNGIIDGTSYVRPASSLTGTVPSKSRQCRAHTGSVMGSFFRRRAHGMTRTPSCWKQCPIAEIDCMSMYRSAERVWALNDVIVAELSGPLRPPA